MSPTLHPLSSRFRRHAALASLAGFAVTTTAFAERAKDGVHRINGSVTKADRTGSTPNEHRHNSGYMISVD